MKVTVFGGASPKPGEQPYEEARRFGFLLGKAGHVVLTGGYIGVMEAVSRGANEAGGHVIGSTCKELDNWRGIKANQWVIEEWSFATLRERMYALIDKCDAAVAMPGGVGTLAEISVMWNEQIISQNSTKPIIIVGEAWHQTVNTFLQSLGSYVKLEDQKLIFYSPGIEETIEIINQIHNLKSEKIVKTGHHNEQ
jgi:uncharacterized protein (TIGR00730 family)